jgi:hypothetical protein
MAKFGRNDQPVTANSTTTVESTTGAPIGTYALVKAGGGPNAHFGNTSPGSRAATDVNMFNNVSSGAFITGATVGVFGVSAAEVANNNTNTAMEHVTHAGWNVRRAGTGPVVGITITANHGPFKNGETFSVSNGTINAVVNAVTNATGNLVSFTISNQGYGFVNAGSVVIYPNRTKWLSAITVSGTANGYSNTDVIVASNGTVNATATISTNTTGGFVTGNVTITNIGMWANTANNNTVVFAVLDANGAPTTGNGASFTATLANSAVTPTLAAVLGGRAGRVHYETLVAMGSLGAQTAAYGTPTTTADSSTDEDYFPGE